MVLAHLIILDYYNTILDSYYSLYCVAVKLFCNAVKPRQPNRCEIRVYAGLKFLKQNNISSWLSFTNHRHSRSLSQALIATATPPQRHLPLRDLLEHTSSTRSASTQTLSQDATAIVVPQLHTATVARPQLHHHAICVRSTPPRVIWVFFLLRVSLITALITYVKNIKSFFDHILRLTDLLGKFVVAEDCIKVGFCMMIRSSRKREKIKDERRTKRTGEDEGRRREWKQMMTHKHYSKKKNFFFLKKKGGEREE